MYKCKIDHERHNEAQNHQNSHTSRNDEKRAQAQNFDEFANEIVISPRNFHHIRVENEVEKAFDDVGDCHVD
jgi:hypothetical protein